MATMSEAWRGKRVLKAEISAAAGFLDIGLSCLLIARANPLASLGWALVGAAGFGLLYFMVSVAAASLGMNAEADGGASTLAERIEHLGEAYETETESDEQGPWVLEALASFALGLMWAAFSVGAVIVGFLRSIVTIIVFATFIDSPAVLAVAATIAASIGSQFVVSALIFEPRAAKIGLEL